MVGVGVAYPLCVKRRARENKSEPGWSRHLKAKLIGASLSRPHVCNVYILAHVMALIDRAVFLLHVGVRMCVLLTHKMYFQQAGI